MFLVVTLMLDKGYIEVVWWHAFHNVLIHMKFVNITRKRLSLIYDGYKYVLNWEVAMTACFGDVKRTKVVTED